MKRKHDVLVDDQNRVDSAAAQSSFAQSNTGQYLQGQDLLTEVKHLGSKGWGLIAKQHVRQGSLVLEYIGDLVSKAEARQRIEEYEQDEIDSLYLLHLSPSYVIDATRQGNKARYMRHSADANCQSQKWVAADNQPRAFMLALRDIAAGEELTFDSYKQCSLGGHVRCMCGPVMCHSNQGTPVLQSQAETELMADAVLKCIQETNFGSLHDLQANQQAASSPDTSNAPHSKQLSQSAVSSLAFASPPHATREDINALGLDSPDSFLDHLHRSCARPRSSLHAITSRCRSIIGQLADPIAPSAQQPAAPSSLQGEGPSGQARHANSGAVLASSQEFARLVSQSLPAEGSQQQQQAVPGRLPRFTEAPTAQAKAFADSPSRQVVQQLQSFLAQYKQVVVGGYGVTSQPGSLQKPALPYKPMKALKSVLGPRLQAGNVTSLDIGRLLREADWPPHLQPPPSHKPSHQPSPVRIAPLPSSSHGATAFPMQPLSAVANILMQKSVASPTGPALLGVRHLGSMLPPSPAAANGSCALTGTAALPSLSCISAAQQQQSGEQHAVPLWGVTGSQAPPNTPEQVQSCLASLGLTGAQIQACLENAQRIEGCL